MCISTICSIKMLPKTWQEVLDALTLRYGETGSVKRMSSDEDLICGHLNEKIYRYEKLPTDRLKM